MYFLHKNNYYESCGSPPPQRIANLSCFLVIMSMSFCCFALTELNTIWLSNLQTLCVLDEGYSRNASCIPNYISVLFLSTICDFIMNCIFVHPVSLPLYK